MKRAIASTRGIKQAISPNIVWVFPRGGILFHLWAATPRHEDAVRSLSGWRALSLSLRVIHIRSEKCGKQTFRHARATCEEMYWLGTLAIDLKGIGRWLLAWANIPDTRARVPSIHLHTKFRPPLAYETVCGAVRLRSRSPFPLSASNALSKWMKYQIRAFAVGLTSPVSRQQMNVSV